jgi:hypothetical protein
MSLKGGNRMNDKWLKQYKDNYNGKSEEAKEIADFVKETYNGASYIPWATMERLTYMQDPNAEFKTILDEEFTGSKLVHTDYFINENSTENKDGIVNKTSAMVVSHFVKVSCTFMGKTFIEEYPIQEQDYSAAKIYNQNLVNKALKRALAKVASRATGLGLKLYENKDLQFDEVIEEKKPEIKKATKKSEPKEETTVVTVEPTNVTTTQVDTTGVTVAPIENVTYTSAVTDLCKLIKETDKDKMNKVLQNVNISVLKKYGYALSTEDTNDELCEKLSKFENIETFTRAINTMLG